MTDSQSALSEVPALLEERRRYESWLAALGRAARVDAEARVRARAGRLSRATGARRRAARVASPGDRGRARPACSRASRCSRPKRGCGATSARSWSSARMSASWRGTRRRARSAPWIRRSDSWSRSGKGSRRGSPSCTALLVDEVTAEPEPEPSRSSAPRASSEPRGRPEPVAVEAAAVEQHAESSQPADVPVAVEQAVEPPAPAAPPSAAAAAPQAGRAASARRRLHAVRRRESAWRERIVRRAGVPQLRGRQERRRIARGEEEGATAGAKHEAPLVERRSSEPLLKAPGRRAGRERGAESLLAGVEHARLATGEHPLAANVPANTPIVLRPATTLEQAKTLKCNECGALNYPTEWYCERCGAELAAL